jgi:hypothetical protein
MCRRENDFFTTSRMNMAIENFAVRFGLAQGFCLGRGLDSEFLWARRLMDRLGEGEYTPSPTEPDASPALFFFPRSRKTRRPPLKDSTPGWAINRPDPAGNAREHIAKKRA